MMAAPKPNKARRVPLLRNPGDALVNASLDVPMGGDGTEPPAPEQMFLDMGLDTPMGGKPDAT
jgi:hypothetical protein